jgi:DNA primase
MNLFSFIKSHVSIFDVVSEYTTLRKAGNYWKARCPFHHEKTASFTVSPHKDIFYCFGCHTSGDVISFTAKVENCSQLEAAQLLAERKNLEIPKDIAFEHHEENMEKKEAYFAICKQIALWCHEELKKSPSVINYLHQRNITLTSIDDFAVGYMPGGMQSIRALTHAMKQLNILQDDLLDTNFLAMGKKVIYSPFEERIIFPIRDHIGRFCGFGGRTFKPEDTRPKYYNSRENDYFIKGSLLFGLPQAKKAIQQAGYTFLVEGYTDCIAMAQYGYTNTVATLGTACTAAHLKQLSRMAPYLYVLYDGDEAGHHAVLRLTELCWQAHMELKVISLPNSQDPDSYLAAGNDLKPAIEHAQDIFVFFIDSMSKELPSQTVHEKVQSARRLIEIIRPIEDPLKQDMLLQKAATTFDVPFESLKRELLQAAPQKRNSAPEEQPAQNDDQEAIVVLSSLEKRIGAAILNNTNLVGETNVSLLRTCLSEPIVKIIDALLTKRDEKSVEFSGLIQNLEPALQNLAHELVVEHEKSIEKQEFQELVLQLQKKRWKHLVHHVKLQLAHAKDTQDEPRVQAILKEFMALKQAIAPQGSKTQ